MESGWNLWVWLVGVVSRRQVWLVGEGESMGVVVMSYIDFLILSLSLLLLYLFSFAAASLPFVHKKKEVFCSCSSTFL